jgi:hypothetical protein
MDNLLELDWFLDDIESCEMIGEFEDEWVYDVEVDDSTHTFISNDILVHNSLFVSFEPAIKFCNWKDLIYTRIDQISKKFIVITNSNISVNNPNCLELFKKSQVEDENDDNLIERAINYVTNNSDIEVIVIDGHFVKNRKLNSDDIQGVLMSRKIFWNWSNELDFIHGIDHFRYGKYFKDCLDEYAHSYGVTNKEDFELERISESIINIAKKKYIQHILFEDGIPYEKLSYIFPKGVELVRSSTPLFAREKIIEIVNYIFSHPDTFNPKDLVKLVKNLRREFELANVDDISMQSSVSKYNEKVLDDVDSLKFQSGAHFAVKASGYYNFLLHKNKESQALYEFIKSGTKIKYYYCKNKRNNDMFAYIRGSYPIEFAPEIDYDLQFYKSIIKPINSIIKPLGMPEITERLTVIMDASGFFTNDYDKYDDNEEEDEDYGDEDYYF